MSFQNDALYSGFEELSAAVSHRAKFGGWIFHATDGSAIWFDLRFTPSAIISHQATAGLSGKLV
ncbi:hypothetical protein HX798_23180 [Pseudomonas putida]|uniref:Uncharacterized protein n=1 Tax=Pseudomonas putida TaxID=303 RepID=A0A7Y7ZG36_PSEPU|nr:hypothetical protein [Pseudomonas putida]NWC83169.1 hypothetical protein [Pseudomonas putida]